MLTVHNSKVFLMMPLACIYPEPSVLYSVAVVLLTLQQTFDLTEVQREGLGPP